VQASITQEDFMLLGLFAIISVFFGLWCIGYFIWWACYGYRKQQRDKAEMPCNALLKLIDEYGSNQKVAGAAHAMGAQVDAAKAQAAVEDVMRRLNDELAIIKKKLTKTYLP
jgi:hypothetical protein